MANEELKQWRVTGVGSILERETKALTKNLGVSISDFVKTTVAEKVRSYPEHLKKFPAKDKD